MRSKANQIHERREPGYRTVGERINDFNEVERRLSEKEIIEQASRCLNCGTPFCHGFACPLANVIPETNQLVSEGRFREALEILLSTHQFPEFTARICPALCEGSCVLGIDEQPVTIRQIEKEIVEKGFENNWIQPEPSQIKLEKSVAVIGSGPAGLAAADLLNKLGYLVTVYDKEMAPGGLLMYGIPNFKLDKKVINRRIELMKYEGVVFENNILAGQDISYRYIKNHAAALVLSGGTQQPRDLNIPGRNLKGTYFATDYLREQNRLIIGELTNEETVMSASGKKVVIIGGGDTGSDCLGTAIRQGAQSVTQLEIMPRAPESRADNNPWPIWPRIDRVSSSHLEGGKRLWQVRPVSIKGDSTSNTVSQLQCVKVEWVSKDGDLTPRDLPGTEFYLDADLILLAMGFVGPGENPLADLLELERDARSNLKVDDDNMTSMEGVFAAGDMATGQSLVVRAMADGKKAAESVHRYLSGGKSL